MVRKVNVMVNDEDLSLMRSKYGFPEGLLPGVILVLFIKITVNGLDWSKDSGFIHSKLDEFIRTAKRRKHFSFRDLFDSYEWNYLDKLYGRINLGRYFQYYVKECRTDVIYNGKDACGTSRYKIVN